MSDVFNPENADPPFGDWPVFKKPPTPELEKHFLFALSLIASAILIFFVGLLIWIGSMTLA